MPECELALVAGYDEEFCLCLNFRVGLVGRLEVAQNLDVWRKHNHILLAAAKRHVKETI